MKRHEILGLLFVSSVASAQVGTNLSGAATADGASPFLNPAAMALEEGTYGGISMGVSLIRLHYEPDDELGASDAFVPKPEPELGIVTDLPGNQWRLGFAFTVPITDGSIWPRDGGAADITRWYVVNGKVFHLAMTPAISFQPWSWLSVGAGVDVIYSRLSADLDKDFGIAFNQAAGSSSIDTPFPYGSDDFAGAVELRASGWNATPVFGILAQPHRMVRIGAGLHLGATTSATFSG